MCVCNVQCLNFRKALGTVLLEGLRQIVIIAAPSAVCVMRRVICIRLIQLLDFALKLSKHLVVIVPYSRPGVRAQVRRVLPLRHKIGTRSGVESA